MKPNYIVIHTAAFRGKNCDANTIDQWHRQRGWSGIGYHYVILNDRHDTKKDGSLETGRPLSQSGAHAKGINSQSIGICCIGHGDEDDFTQAQYQTLYTLLKALLQQHQLSHEAIIGHREINKLIGRGLVDEQYKTGKSCPGHKVDMDVIRSTLSEEQPQTKPPTSNYQQDELIHALKVLNAHREQFANAKDELDEFLYHPEVLELQASIR